MKNLNKFAAQQLSKNQMNNVNGGTSSSCPTGQQIYSCILMLGGVGVGTTAVICGTSKEDAEMQANTTLMDIIINDKEDGYVCN